MNDNAKTNDQLVADARHSFENSYGEWDYERVMDIAVSVLESEPTHDGALALVQDIHSYQSSNEVRDAVGALRQRQTAGTWYAAGDALYGAVNAGGPPSMDVATLFFNQAFALDPHPVIAGALSAAYCSMRQPARAMEILRQVGPCDDPDFHVHVAWTKLLLGDPSGAEFCLAQYADGSGYGQNTESILGKLQQVRDRLVAVGIVPHNVRTWHLIQYGTIVTDLSVTSRSRDGDAAVSGRYGYFILNHDHVRRLLGRLLELVRRAPVAPDCVIAAEGRDSQILAEAFSRISGLPIVPADSAVKGVLIGSTGRDVTRLLLQLKLHRQLRPGQISYSLSDDWDDPRGMATDAVGLLSESELLVMPWQGSMGGTSEGKLVSVPPDEGSVAEAAAKVVQADPTDSDLAAFTQWLDSPAVRASALTFTTVSRRLEVYTDSPVAL